MILALLGMYPAHAWETFEGALEYYQAREYGAAFRRFEELANRGDRRAQFITGLMLLEGRGVPVDRVRGYSWVQIAAQGHFATYGLSRENYAAESLLLHARSLSGPELIRAERDAQQFIRAKDAEGAELTATARRVLLGEVPVMGDQVLTGCAIDRSIRGCGNRDAAQAPRPSCTGVLPAVDSAPTRLDGSAGMTAPRYPLSARRISWEGTVIGLAHFDWTGYVCKVTLVVGSGSAAIDGAALEAMRTWHLKPATAGGEPVEAFSDAAATFGIEEYELDLD